MEQFALFSFPFTSMKVKSFSIVCSCLYLNIFTRHKWNMTEVRFRGLSDVKKDAKGLIAEIWDNFSIFQGQDASHHSNAGKSPLISDPRVLPRVPSIRNAGQQQISLTNCPTLIKKDMESLRGSMERRLAQETPSGSLTLDKFVF